MYGMSGHRFGNMMKVGSPAEMQALVKEAQIAGKSSRPFFVGGKEIKLSYDGMFLVDATSCEIVREDNYANRPIYTPVLS